MPKKNRFTKNYNYAYENAVRCEAENLWPFLTHDDETNMLRNLHQALFTKSELNYNFYGPMAENYFSKLKK